jgi:hypothetical protein
MLDGAIRIAIMMMAMRSVSSDSRIGKDQLAFGHMRRVLGQQLNDTVYFGDKEQLGEPDAQTTQYGLPNHFARASNGTCGVAGIGLVKNRGIPANEM